MSGDHDDPIFRPGVLGDDVANGKLPFESVGRECSAIDVIAFEVSEDVVFKLFMIGASNRPRSERDYFFDVLHGAGGIDGGSRKSGHRFFSNWSGGGIRHGCNRGRSN